MAKRTVLAALAISCLVGGSTARATSPDRMISFRVAGAPANLGPTSNCPDGFLRTRLLSQAGKRIGTSTICVVRASKTERPGYAIGSITERVIERDFFPHGTIVSRATYVFRWITRDGSVATATIRGRVVGGTGRYARMTGTISGNGYQRRGRQELVVVIRLR